METVRFSETLATTYESVRRQITKQRHHYKKCYLGSLKQTVVLMVVYKMTLCPLITV